MKPPIYDIGDKVFFALVPGGYEKVGPYPGIDPSKTYVFEGRVGGLRWEPAMEDWLYEVYNCLSTFWTWAEYIGFEQKDATRAVAMASPKKVPL